MLKWLRLFRAVNLPTVPGDVFVGAAAVVAGAAARDCAGLRPVWWAAGASVLIYMFGLVQNDIMGAKTDKNRPIPDGEISLDAAYAAAAACLAGAAACAYAGGLFCGGWWRVAALLVVSITLYNRFKSWWMMGVCRALNVYAGAAAAGGANLCADMLAVLWWLYISLVTLYSEGEEADPAKKRRVGFLVGATVYLQLSALIALNLVHRWSAPMRTLLVAGALMLAALRAAKMLMPKVSAS